MALKDMVDDGQPPLITEREGTWRWTIQWAGQRWQASVRRDPETPWLLRMTIVSGVWPRERSLFMAHTIGRTCTLAYPFGKISKPTAERVLAGILPALQTISSDYFWLCCEHAETEVALAQEELGKCQARLAAAKEEFARYREYYGGQKEAQKR